MELKKGIIPLHTLFLGSFGAAARSYGSVIILAILLFIISTALSWGLVKLGLISLPQLMAAGLLMGLISMFLSSVLQLGVINILDGKLEKNGRTIPEALMRSLLPALVFTILMVVVPLPLALLIRFSASMLTPLLAVIALLLLVLGGVLFIFVPQALALRSANPVGAVVLSFQLVAAHYLRVLAALILFAVIPGLFLFLSAAAVSTYLIPFLVQQGWMSMTAPFSQFGWYGVAAGIVYMLLFYYVLLSMVAALTALFLNLDYLHNRPVGQFEPETDPNIPPPADRAFVAADLLAGEEVQVLTSSVKSVDHHDDLAKQFDSVYSSLEKDQFQQQAQPGDEEDRMPTIFFDEDMARQLAQNNQPAKAKPTENKGPEGPDSIKISQR